MKSRLTLLGVMALVAACKGPAAVAPRPASPKPAAASASPALKALVAATPAASAEATPAATGTATPTPLLAGTPLVKPGGALEVDGQLRIDASYAVAHQAGTLLSNNGASVVGFGDQGKAGLISEAGGALISEAGGALISDLGGAFKAGLISEAGGALISNNGGSLISEAGGALIGKIRYRVQDAQPLSAGTVLPAAGMALRVVSLATGRSVPLGQDANGAPAYEISSDAGGKYRLYLPADVDGTLALVAYPAGGSDQRLLYTRLLNHPKAGLDTDEDSAKVVEYIRESSTANFLLDFTLTPDTTTIDQLLPADVGERVLPGKKAMVAAFQAAGLSKLPADQQRQLALRMTDAVLATVVLDDIMVDPARSIVPYNGVVEPAMGALSNGMADIREHVGQLMAFKASLGQDPTAFFAGKDYVQLINQKASPPFEIRKPADFNDFIIRGFVADASRSLFARLNDLGSVLEDPDLGLSDATLVRLDAADQAILTVVLGALYADDSPSMKAVLAIAGSAKAP